MAASRASAAHYRYDPRPFFKNVDFYDNYGQVSWIFVDAPLSVSPRPGFSVNVSVKSVQYDGARYPPKRVDLIHRPSNTSVWMTTALADTDLTERFKRGWERRQGG